MLQSWRLPNETRPLFQLQSPGRLRPPARRHSLRRRRPRAAQLPFREVTEPTGPGPTPPKQPEPENRVASPEGSGPASSKTPAKAGEAVIAAPLIQDPTDIEPLPIPPTNQAAPQSGGGSSGQPAYRSRSRHRNSYSGTLEAPFENEHRMHNIEPSSTCTDMLKQAGWKC